MVCLSTPVLNEQTILDVLLNKVYMNSESNDTTQTKSFIINRCRIL